MATVIGDLLVQLGVDLTDLEQGLGTAGDRLEKFGNKMFFLGARISAGITVPIVGAVAVISKLGLEFDKAMTESLAIAGAKADGMRDIMEDVAMGVSESMKFTAKEAAEGFYPLISAGLDAAESMKALPTVAQFAQAGVMNLALATEYLAGAEASMARNMDGVRDKTAGMAHIADVLTEANNRAIGTVQDFAAALSNKAGAALSIFGKTVEEGVAVLAAFSEQNIRGKAAGQQLMMVLRDLSTYALKNADAFAKFKIQVFDAGGNMRNVADIIEDFEKATLKMSDAQKTQMFNMLQIPLRSVNATKALIGYSDAIRDHERALLSAAGVTKTVADNQMKSLSNQLQVLKNSFSNVAIGIFNSFVPIIQDTLIPMLHGALAVVKDFGRWIEDLSPMAKQMAVAFLAVIAAIGPLLALLGSAALLLKAFTFFGGVVASGMSLIATSLGTMAGGATVAAGGLGVFSAALAILVNPITLTVVAIGALAGAYYLFTTALSDTEREIVSFGNEFKKNGRVFTSQTSDLEGLLRIFEELNPRMDLTEAENYQLAVAVRELAAASGLSENAFLREANASGKLTGELWAQIKARKAAMANVKAEAHGELEAAANALQTIEARIADIRSGKGKDTRTTMVGEALGTEEVEFSATRRAQEIAKLTSRADEARRKFDEAKIAYNELMGIKGGDVHLGPEKPPKRPGLDDDEGGMPDVVAKALTGDAKKIQDALFMLKDVNKELIFLKAAWDKLTPSEQANAAVLDNLWQAYSKLAIETGILVPEFDALFASQWRQRDLAIELKNVGEDWFGTWSDGLVKLNTDASAVLMMLGNLTASEASSFWTKHATTMEDALKVYQELEPSTQRLVDKYMAWKAAASGVGSELSKTANAASLAMTKLLEDTQAKMIDMEENVANFSASAATGHARAMRTKLAEMTTNYQQERRKQVMAMSTMNKEEILAHIEKLKQMDLANDRYLDAYGLNQDQQLYKSMGTSKKMQRAFELLGDVARQEAIEAQEAWLQMMDRIGAAASNLSAYGDFASMFGLDKMGEALKSVSGDVANIGAAMNEFRNAETGGEKMAAAMKAAVGLYGIMQKISQLETRGERTASMAMTGMEIGGGLVPGWGHVIGLGVGALIGVMMDDPQWVKMKNAVKEKWGIAVSDALAEKIAEDSQRLHSKVAAMFTNLGEAMAEGEVGGMSTRGESNAGMWAGRAADLFQGVAQGQLTLVEAGNELDEMFGQLVEHGTSTTGFLNDQVRTLIMLEKQYKTGSKAIKEYVQAQLGMAAEGFGKVVSGSFGSLMGIMDESRDADAALEKRNNLNERALKLRAQISDFEKKGVKTEAQRVALALARVELARVEREIATTDAKRTKGDAILNSMMGPEGQEAFDRMGRLGAVTFDAMIASGMSLTAALAAMGPAFDTLIAAQDAFGFSSSESFTKLMKLREFATVHPGLMEQLDGLNQMMMGLSNTGYLTDQAFVDLGAVARDVYDDMIEGGLSSDEAMQFMQPTLQRLWELQQQFGFATDEATQALIDEAVAAGAVGAAHMSAADKMVLGIDKVVSRLDLLLKYLGIEIPAAAGAGADALVTTQQDALDDIQTQYDNFHPDFDIHYRFIQDNEPNIPGDMTTGPVDPLEMAEGGVFTRPVVAGEAGPEAFIPLDRLFTELENARQSGNESGMTIIVVKSDGNDAEELYAALPSQVRKNVRGLKTQLIEALK